MYESDPSTPGLQASWFTELQPGQDGPARDEGEPIDLRARLLAKKQYRRAFHRHRAALRANAAKPRPAKPPRAPSGAEFVRDLGDTRLSDAAIDEFHASICARMERRLVDWRIRRGRAAHSGHARRHGSNSRLVGSRRVSRASSRGGDSGDDGPGDDDPAGEPDPPPAGRMRADSALPSTAPSRSHISRRRRSTAASAARRPMKKPDEGSWTPRAMLAGGSSRSWPLLRDYLDEHKIATGRGGDDLVFGRTAADPFIASTIRNRAPAAWEAANLATLRAIAHELGVTVDEKASREDIEAAIAATDPGAKLPALLEPITLHECRNTFASMLIHAGVNPKAIQEFMGHSTIEMTFDRYGHLMPGSREQARERVDAYLAAECGPKDRGRQGVTGGQGG